MMAGMRALLIAFLVSGQVGCGQRVLFRGEAPGLGTVLVVQQKDGVRALRFGHVGAEDQSLYDPSRPGHEPVGYVRTSLLALACLGSGSAREQHGRLLMVGLGGGSYLRHVSRLAPRMTLEAVEISPLVVQVCRRYFSCPDAEIHVADGRRHIQRTRRRYDIVFIDAYDADDYPRHLGTREFFEAVRRVLSPTGIAVANLSPNSDADRADLLLTFRTVFPDTLCFTTPSDNSVALGFVRPPPAKPTLRARVAALDRSSGGRYRLAEALGRRCEVELESARVLSDKP
jgi:spermidine synthase